jgi:hypothetical protein
MLRKPAVVGAAMAAFAGLGLAAPAYATPDPDNAFIQHGYNVNNFYQNDSNPIEQSRNVIVCGNRGIGDVTAILVPIAPTVFTKPQPVDCSVRVYQAPPGRQ